jgi:hypothetical protein
VSNPYRDPAHQTQPPAPATPTLWKLRVWWESLSVSSTSGRERWWLVYRDENGKRRACWISWGNCKNIAERCENTPAGEPAPLLVEGTDEVVFIHPAQVPTVARLARQAANALERLTPAP